MIGEAGEQLKQDTKNRDIPQDQRHSHEIKNATFDRKMEAESPKSNTHAANSPKVSISVSQNPAGQFAETSLHNAWENDDVDLSSTFKRVITELEREAHHAFMQRIVGNPDNRDKMNELIDYVRAHHEGLRALLHEPSFDIHAVRDMTTLYTKSRRYEKDIASALSSAASANIGEIITILDEDVEDSEQYDTTLGLLDMVWDTPQVQKQAVDALVRNIKKIKKVVDKKQITSVNYIERIFQFGDKDQKRSALFTTLTEGDIDDILNMIKSIPYEQKNGFQLVVSDIFDSELTRLELDSTSIKNDWENSTPDIENRTVLNMASIERLELERPGLVKVLHDEFGISDFSRYPDSVLIRQYDERNNTNLPYGVVIYPKGDHNGAFYQDSQVFTGLVDALSGRYALRIYEAGSRLQVAKCLARANARYNKGGEGHKISFGILGGHGTVDSIWFGSDTREGEDGGLAEDKFGAITSDDLPAEKSTIAGRIVGEYFEIHPSIVLVSCSTGQANANKGFARTMSELNAEVTGPDRDSAVKSISVSFDENGKAHLSAIYRNDAIAHTFTAGELLS